MSCATDSSPYVPEMKSMKVIDLLNAMSSKYLKKGSSLKIKEIGLQPGENLHEKVLENGKPSNEAEHFTQNEICKLI